jgi:Icc-related predicted phosphoesterase
MKYLEEIRPQFKRIIGIPGNHDFHFQDYPNLIREFKKEVDVDILLDRVENVMGIRIFGSPWVPDFGGWAYMYPRPTMRWLHRPQSDIVLTHGPMLGILDSTPRGESVGCSDLKDSIYRMNPKPRVFINGHIHYSYGKQEVDGVLCINASTCNEQYNPVNLPQVFEL